MNVLKNFFSPRSVAVVGASRAVTKVGYTVLDNLIKDGFKGPIYPINPKAESILGRKAFPNLQAVGAPIDLAIIVVPARFVSSVLDDCHTADIPCASIITAGFKETGVEGRALEEKISQKVREYGIRVVGPNCLGTIDTYANLNASFAADMPNQGNISFFSQSGALFTAILDWALGEHVGFSRMVSLGNKCDVDETDVLEMLVEDPNTNVIMGYLEGITDGVRFISKAKEISRRKPILIAKSGTTEEGARAVSSHTGSMTGSDTAFDTAFWQAGIIRAGEIREMLDCAVAFAMQPIPEQKGLCILTNAGGPGIVATDAAVRAGVPLAKLTEKTRATLREKLPPTAAVGNPVDVIGDAPATRYQDALDAVMADPNVGGTVVLLTPQSITQIEETAKVVSAAAAKEKKPVLAAFMGKEAVSPGISILQENGIPNYPYAESAVFAYAKMLRFRAWKKLPPFHVKRLPVDRDTVDRILSQVQREGRRDLTSEEALEVVRAYGIGISTSELARTAEEASRLAERIGFPVALKIASQDILHKSDAGGVRLGLRRAEEVPSEFEDIVRRAKEYAPEAKIDGVLIQEMVTEGKEVILGASRDPSFGPLIMFGLGGIYVEMLRDVSYRLAPLALEDTTLMIRETRGFPMLAGARGEPPSDIGAVQDAILRVSQLVVDFPCISEMDINPLKVFRAGEGAKAVDARISVSMDR